MTVLVSWIAYNNDFKIDEETNEIWVNPLGTHCDLYNDEGFDFERHYLLTTSTETNPSDRIIKLIQHLKSRYSRDVEPVFMNVEDVIDLRAIYQKVQGFVLGHKQEDIDIFISPGTAVMQTAWYLLGNELGEKVKLFQRRRPADRKDGNLENEYIDVGVSKISGFLTLREHRKKTRKKSSLCITKTIREKTYDLADHVAHTDAVTVFINAPRGTGKENLARYIHRESSRSEKPFVVLPCGSLTDEILESQLFGHKKGMFSGAIDDHKGYFEQANGGTIFLDELGDASGKLQSSLLRTIQEKKIQRMGEHRQISVDVRFISATNKDIHKLIEDGRFRPDLYDRLNTVILTLPLYSHLPRQEKEQILHFVVKDKASDFEKSELKFSKESLNRILTHPFEGNLRELHSLVDHLYTFSNGGQVEMEDLPDSILRWVKPSSLDWQDNINQHILRVLGITNSNVEEAARLLNVSPTPIRNRINKYSLTDSLT